MSDAHCEYRLLTARGVAAIAVLELRARDARSLVEASGGLGLTALPAPSRFGLRRIEIARDVVEEALVVRVHDAGLELHTHGNPRIVDLLVGRLEACGARAARAPRAGDERARILALAQAAPSRIGLEACLYQLGADGLLAHRARDPERREEGFWSEVGARGRALEPFLRPRRVALRGRTNAGKSTLFNLLFGRPRVLVGADRGLTRDSVEELVVLPAGLPLRLVDVAGEHEDAGGGAGRRIGELEQRAVEAGRRMQAAADLVLRVVDARDELASRPDARELLVRTHADLLDDPRADAERGLLCSLTRDDKLGLAQRIEAAIRRALAVDEPQPGPAEILDVDVI